jgi:hypothetical protein
MIYKTISAKAIIAKIYRDFKPTIPGWESNAIEWIGEAAEAIGQSAGLVKKSTGNEGCLDAITIVDHRAKLPCDLVNLQAVEYQGKRLPYGADLTGYGLTSASRTTDIYTNSGSGFTTEVIAGNNEGTQNEIDLVESQNRGFGPEGIVTDYYLINPNYIQTSFETGHIKLHYQAYPTCADGYPLVPDDYYYTTAISWYVMSKLCLLGYNNPVVNFKQSHDFWCEYKRLAQNKAAFPSIDKMDRFMNMWVRLIPVRNAADDFFAGGETSESIKYV